MAYDRVPPTFPAFDNVEDERRYRKQRLAAAFRLFGQFGFDEGAAGHITARDPELLDHFWVNPLGMNFRQVRVKDLLLVNENTSRSIESRVVYAKKELDGHYYVGVEFVNTDSNFWKMTFPVPGARPLRRPLGSKAMA